jgi:hypothetical protein
MELWSRPDVLIVHLKRFRSHGRYGEKISSEVFYPIEVCLCLCVCFLCLLDISYLTLVRTSTSRRTSAVRSGLRSRAICTT